jgi:hypothetical protein
MVPNDAHRLSGNLAQPREQEELEDRKPVSEGAYPADYPSLRDKSRSSRLRRVKTLIVIVLLSLGLWWVIWLAVRRLASALLSLA